MDKKSLEKMKPCFANQSFFLLSQEVLKCFLNDKLSFPSLQSMLLLCTSPPFFFALMQIHGDLLTVRLYYGQKTLKKFKSKDIKRELRLMCRFPALFFERDISIYVCYPMDFKACLAILMRCFLLIYHTICKLTMLCSKYISLKISLGRCEGVSWIFEGEAIN